VEERILFRDSYREFLAPGDLCFDIGANLGNRVLGFRALDCKVVALEPQSYCFSKLERGFGVDNQVVLINQAVGRVPGEMNLHISPNHVLSSFSEKFIQRTSESGRFAKNKWSKIQKCQVTTLDELIVAHGVPDFIKIDVEGFESEVLAGLSTPVPAVSIEWVPELPENASECIRLLVSLGNYEFNISWVKA